jgi:hypothetical protein
LGPRALIEIGITYGLEKMMVKSRFGGPLFLVGASRSGTALMRSVLNRHSDVCVSGETHYFDDLRARFADPMSGPLGAEDKKRCEDYFMALTHRPYGHGGEPGHGWLKRKAILSGLTSDSPSPDEYFVTYCGVTAERAGARIWGEKTPRHIFRLEDMLKRFPNAKVIAMVRDPRAVVASYRDWKNQGGFDLEKDPGHADALEADQKRSRRSYNILVATMLWKSGVASALGARDHYGADVVRLVNYEQLVLEPRNVLESIAEWLGVEFQEVMMDAPILNSSFHPFDDSGGFQRNAVDHWKERLSESEVSVIECCAGSALIDSGYDQVGDGSISLRYVWEIIKLPFAALRALIANRERIANAPEYIWRRAQLLLRGASPR